MDTSTITACRIIRNGSPPSYCGPVVSFLSGSTDAAKRDHWTGNSLVCSLSAIQCQESRSTCHCSDRGSRECENRQPIALVGHDGLELGAGRGDPAGLPTKPSSPRFSNTNGSFSVLNSICLVLMPGVFACLGILHCQMPRIRSVRTHQPINRPPAIRFKLLRRTTHPACSVPAGPVADDIQWPAPSSPS